jgi:DNA-binding NarL/FixJ family response regulator
MNCRVLISDDHRLLRDGLRSLLQKTGFEVVGEAGDGRTAVKLAKKTDPDAVILDISMPFLNGVDATRQLATEVPQAKVIIMSMHGTSHFVLGALHAGAAGYLLKDTVFDELLVALRAVLKGHIYISPAIAGTVVRASFRTSLPGRELLGHRTSSREREVLQLLVDGKSTKEIAAMLCVSVKTIETHRKRFMDKLNLHNVAELTKYAVREGLTTA